MANKIIRVDQDAAIAWAFRFMGKDTLTINEINSYLEVLRGILPQNYVLFGVRDAIDFVIERYPNVFKLENNNIKYFQTTDSIRWFSTNNISLNLYKEACEILKSINEVTDEVNSQMVLKKTI